MDETLKVQSRSRLRTTTVMLVGIVLAQLILGTPGIIFSVVHASDNTKHVHDAVRDSIYTTLLTLTITNNAINFYIYFLTTRGFREAFYSLFLSTEGTVSLSLAPTVEKSCPSNNDE